VPRHKPLPRGVGLRCATLLVGCGRARPSRNKLTMRCMTVRSRASTSSSVGGGSGRKVATSARLPASTVVPLSKAVPPAPPSALHFPDPLRLFTQFRRAAPPLSRHRLVGGAVAEDLIRLQEAPLVVGDQAALEVGQPLKIKDSAVLGVWVKLTPRLFAL
jgi:hypothetical protein